MDPLSHSRESFAETGLALLVVFIMQPCSAWQFIMTVFMFVVFTL